MLFNIVIFIWVIVVLIGHTRSSATRRREEVSGKTMIRLMISISGVMFLFGLTWLFAILTFSAPGLRETFQILFTIFNSFQGFFIFLFFCVFNKDALESWKSVLSCRKYSSKQLHPSLAISKAKKPNTGSTGLTSLSGTFPLTSKSYSDTAMLLKGNIYEKAPFDFESKVDLGTHSTFKDSVAENEGVIQTPLVAVMEQTAPASGASHQGEQYDDAGTIGEQGKKIKEAKSLKFRIKRYSTKKISKHHVEEAEVYFDSDDSS